MNENEKGYTDWLYNRYVDAVRINDHVKAGVYLDLLERCLNMFTTRKFSRLRRYARERLKVITNAQRKSALSKLLLTGEEGTREFEKNMYDYEQGLREMLFSEETIRELVIEKKINYGSDI